MGTANATYVILSYQAVNPHLDALKDVGCLLAWIPATNALVVSFAQDKTDAVKGILGKETIENPRYAIDVRNQTQEVVGE